MSSFCQGIICIIWITWNSCRSVLHPVVILPPPLLSLSVYKMDALIRDSHPHNNNNSCVCGVWCMELPFLHDGFEIRNLVIQSMMSLSLYLSVSLSLGYLQRSLLWDNWQHQWLFWNLQRHKDTDADITISCVPMDYRYIYMYLCCTSISPAFQLWFQKHKNKPWDHKELWGANFGCNLNGRQQGNTDRLMMLVPVLWMGVVQPCIRDAPVD
jgi:hypothetical protein